MRGTKSAELWLDIVNMVPVPVLQTKYSTSAVACYLPSYDAWHRSPLHPISELMNIVMQEKYSAEWLLAFFKWIFDDCHISVSENFLHWPEIGEDKPFFGTVLDLVVLTWYSFVDRVVLMEFLLKRGAQSRRSLDTLLPYCRRDIEVQLLLDAGAKSYPNDKHYSLYVSRQAARAAIYAVLAAAKRRGDLRGLVARELWRWIAKMVWSKRWNFL